VPLGARQSEGGSDIQNSPGYEFHSVRYNRAACNKRHSVRATNSFVSRIRLRLSGPSNFDRFFWRPRTLALTPVTAGADQRRRIAPISFAPLTQTGEASWNPLLSRPSMRLMADSPSRGQREDPRTLRKVFAPPVSSFASALPGLVRVRLNCVNMRGLYGWSKNRIFPTRARVGNHLTRFWGEAGFLLFAIFCPTWACTFPQHTAKASRRRCQGGWLFHGVGSALTGLVRVSLSCVNMRGLYGWSKSRIFSTRARVLNHLTMFWGKEGFLYFGEFLGL
jgi:hypothetical protein